MTGARILVVEDSGIVAMDIQNKLRKLGYTIVGTTAYGEEAVTKAEETRPNLVLMDIVLKGAMDGVEAAGQIRSRLSIPVVYLTGQSDPQTIQRAKVTEPLGYILKPFDERVLQTTIEMALYKHELENESRQEKTQELEAVIQVARILAQQGTYREKCQTLLRELVRIAGAESVTLRAPDPKGESLCLIDSAGPATWQRTECLPIKEGIAGETFRSGKPLLINDYAHHPLAKQISIQSGIKSMACLPIKSKGRVLAVVTVASSKSDYFSPRMESVLAAIANRLGIV